MSEKTKEQISTDVMAKVIKKNMKEYGLDVAQDRILEDYRDGLKPVQRHLLSAMMDLKAWSSGKTHKCARIVGQAMGLYHPHGDASLYQALVNMVNANCPIVEGQGNFGSLTDGPAASRYTEARMSKLGMKMFECNSVMETIPNYTGDTTEPVVIPTRLPLYIMNGTSGIGVGLVCRMPSHNLKEVVEALKYVVRKGEQATIKGVLKRMPAPDYSYGGRIISDYDEIYSVYKNGTGKIQYSCDYHFENNKNITTLVVTGFCPDFNPDAFLVSMGKLAEQDLIVKANNAGTRTEPNRIEVEFKNPIVFEKNIKKQLEKSVTYQFYALERTKSNDEEKDVDVEIKTPNIIDVMQMWLDWRRVVETQMLKLDLKNNRLALYKEKLKLDSSKNINVITDSVKQDKQEPRDYLLKHLPILIKSVKDGKKEKAYFGADYILDQKIISLKKADQPKLESNIKEILKKIKQNKYNLEHIDDVIVKYLDELKPFYTERKLKLKGDYEDVSLKKHNHLDNVAVLAITKDGKKCLVKKGNAKYFDYATTYDDVYYASVEGTTRKVIANAFDGTKERGFNSSGLANGDCSRLLYLSNLGKFLIIDCDDTQAFNAVKLKDSEYVKQMLGIYKGTQLIVYGTNGKVGVVNSNDYESNRKNTFAKQTCSGFGFNQIANIIPIYNGCDVLTPNGIIDISNINKHTNVLGGVGDYNFVIMNDDTKCYMKKEVAISKCSDISKIIPIKFKGRK